MGAAEHGRLIDREVDDAVGNDDVEAPGFKSRRIELLDISFAEADFAARPAKAFPVPGEMRIGGFKLLVGHVDADHFAFAPHQLREDVDVTTGAGAEIEHTPPFELER